MFKYGGDDDSHLLGVLTLLHCCDWLYADIFYPMVRFLFFIPLRTMSCSSMGER